MYCNCNYRFPSAQYRSIHGALSVCTARTSVEQNRTTEAHFVLSGRASFVHSIHDYRHNTNSIYLLKNRLYVVCREFSIELCVENGVWWGVDDDDLTSAL